MLIAVNGTRLWFDVEGAALEPVGAGMHERPTIVLVHGGPGSYDHSYLKPAFSRLAGVAQVVYLDLRDHGRSARHDPADWTFDLCADDIRAFCDALGIVRPIVLGHSMGAMIASLYAARHPGHAGSVVLVGSMARFDLARIVEGFRRVAGDEVAQLARRSYSGDTVSESDWAKVFAAFGPNIPTDEVMARRTRNLDLRAVGMTQLGAFDMTAQLTRITSPTLVCVGELDPVTPVGAAHEIVDALARGIGHLEVFLNAGHFTWLDVPDQLFARIERFVTDGR